MRKEVACAGAEENTKKRYNRCLQKILKGFRNFAFLLLAERGMRQLEHLVASKQKFIFLAPLCHF